jgi:hypothetical protein
LARSRFFVGRVIERKTGFQPRIRGAMLFLIALWAAALYGHIAEFPSEVKMAR